MSNPVVTDKWAGNYDCSICRRKRLMAEEFSKKAIDRFNKEGVPLRCKTCLSEQETKERRNAASVAVTNETRECAKCMKVLDSSYFNKNQWNKGEGKSRCKQCVEQAIKEEEEQNRAKKSDSIAKAKEEVEKAKANGNPLAILKAESVLSSVEAEKVTGLKPVRMNRGGRGRGRGRGRR